MKTKTAKGDIDIDLDGKATGCRHMPKFGLGDSKAKTPHQKGDLDVDINIDVEGYKQRKNRNL